MKKHLLIIVLLVCAAAFSFAQEARVPEFMLAPNATYGEEMESDVPKLDYNPSFSMGKTDAKLHHVANGYFLGGLASGLLFGILGTVVIGFAAGGDTPEYIPDNVDVKGYIDGYYEKAKSKNKGAAWMGGFIGTAASVAMVVALSNNLYDR